MAKSKSKKKQKQTKELVILIILIFISAGLLTAMFTLYNQRKKQINSSEDVQIPALPEDETIATVPVTPSEQPVETIPETTEVQDEYAQRAEQMLQEMSIEDKIYQMFIVTPEVLVDNAVSTVVQTGNMSKEYLEKKPVGGLVYFAQNLENEAQALEMISTAQNYVQSVNHHIGMWIAVDEEGGTVARVADNLGTTAFEDMSVYGELNQKDEVFMMGSTIAEDIAKFGFNLDFAPVTDVYINPANELQNRIFSDDPAVVSDMVSAMVQGLQNSGEVSATLKHFPGLGAEDGNTHEDAFTRIDRTYEELTSVDFLPFESGIQAGADFVMVGHQIISCAEDDLPSDLSPTVITEWLRQNLGFNGIVITDAHNMHTITDNYSSGEAALLAVQAGADIVLMPSDLNDAFDTLKAAVDNGELSEERVDESVRRILTVKAKHHLL